MLLWQPQSSPSARLLVLVSLTLHLIACFALLFVYKEYHQRLFVDLSARIPSQAVVKLLPLSHPRPTVQTRTTKGTSGLAEKSQREAKSKKKAATSLAKQSVSVKAKKAQVQKKKHAVAAKKQPKTKTDQDPSKRVLKELQQKSEEKPIQKEQPKAPEVAAKQEVMPELTQAVPAQQLSKGESPGLGEEIVYLSKQEFDALQIQHKLQECLFDLWTPPAGIPAQTFCEVMVTIGWDGTLLESQFLKKTGILMYDLSVQETLEEVSFPHELWGKQITIAFKP